jgi:hypothetical protein
MLSVAVGCSVRHLENRWTAMRRAVEASGSHVPPLKKFLNSLLVLHALRLRLSEPFLVGRWSGIGKKLGVTDRTVRNVMYDVLEVVPSGVTISNVVPLIMKLESEILSPFT